MFDLKMSLVAVWGVKALLCADVVLAASFADYYGVLAKEPSTTNDVDENESFAPQVKLPVKVIMAKTVHVAKDRILLGDVASCIGVKTLCEEVNSVDLGKSPLPGNSLRLKRGEILSILATEIGAADATVDAPDLVNVMADWQALSEGDVSQALGELLADKADQSLPFLLSVQKVYIPSGLKLRPGPYRVEFAEFIEESSKFMARKTGWGLDIMQLSAHVASIDEQWEDQRIDFKVKVNVAMQVVVAMRDLKKGDFLQNDDVSLDFRGLKRMPPKKFDSVAGLVGLVVRRAVAKGEILQANQLEVNKIVKRGDTVKVRLSTDDLDVQSSGVALDDGGQGERISVAVGKSKKKFAAKIMSKSMVEVIR